MKKNDQNDSPISQNSISDEKSENKEEITELNEERVSPKEEEGQITTPESKSNLENEEAIEQSDIIEKKQQNNGREQRNNGRE